MKVCIETYGCSANQAESEIMAGLLADAGFKQTEAMEDSDLTVINTCFVKSPTEQKILQRIKEVVKNHPEKGLIIAGCMPEVIGGRLRTVAPDASFVSTHNITRIVEAAENTLKGVRTEFTGNTGEKKLCRPRIRRNPLIGITEISQGCNSHCSYCCVRLAKGSLDCYAPEDIVKDVESALSGWCREIWITSQDNSAYIHEGRRLPELIDNICGIPGDFWIRIGMMNPGSLLNIMDSLVDNYGNRKVYKFLHVPVQSGSDRVLRIMRRRYRVSDFVRIVSRFREAHPRITISTDVIVGFPGETEDDFKKTVNLIKEARPDIVNISKFGPRPGTEAARMDQVKSDVIKGRSGEISGLARKLALERNREWIGWSGDVLITGKGKRKWQWIGRNMSYKPVVVESRKDILGGFVKVKITGASMSHLEGFFLGS